MVDKSGQVGRKTKIKPLDESHPYKEYEGTKLWKTIDKAIDDLVENQDLEETTPRSYIVGYLCKKISEEKSFSLSTVPDKQP